MPVELAQSIFTVIGSGFCAWVAVKVEIKWIVRTLDRHEGYHNIHFKQGVGDRRNG